MNKDMDKLTELEKENRELIARIKSNADAQNRSMTLPQLDITDSEPGMLHRRIPSWIAVAAMLAGVVIGCQPFPAHYLVLRTIPVLSPKCPTRTPLRIRSRAGGCGTHAHTGGV